MRYRYYLLIVVAVLAAGVAVSLLLLRRTRHWSPADRVILAAVPPGIAALVIFVALNALQAPGYPWNGIRTARIFYAAFGGLGLYSEWATGPALGLKYGPLGYLPYLPTVAFSSPTAAIIAAAILSHAMVFIPALAAILAPRHLTAIASDVRGALRILGAFLAFALSVAAATPLLVVARTVHVDPAAVGFGLAACAALTWRHRRPTAALWTSAIMVALAGWSKQTMVPLAVMLPAFMLIAGGRRELRRYAFALAVSGIVVSAALCMAYHADRMYFQMVTLFRHHGVQYLRLISLAPFVEAAWPFIAVLAVYYAVFARRRGGVVARIRRIASSRPAPYVFAGVGLVPTSLLAYIKHGGYVNSVGVPTAFFAVAAAVALHETLVRARRIDRRAPGRELVAARLVAALAVCFMVIEASTALSYETFARTTARQRNGDQIAYEFARRHPDQVYAPWNPLATYMADGRFHHFQYELAERDWAGFAIDAEHSDRHVPQDLTYVIRDPRVLKHDCILRYLPDFDATIRLPELPGWDVHVRGESASLALGDR